MNLSNLKPAAGSTKKKKRIGRGQGSGRGGTSTRGHKGAGSRSGYSVKVGFEGGQMPLQRRVPKFGCKNPNRVEYVGINLDILQSVVDKFNLTTVDFEGLIEHGFVSKNDLIKILGRGELTAKVEVKAHEFSASAQTAIEAAGGSIVKLYLYMKKLITTLTNIWKIEELRNRTLNTLLFLLIYRVGCHVVLPGVNPDALVVDREGGNDIMNLINMFAGGSFSRAAIFALGVMPYISASIVVQLLGIAVPAFQKMQKEGESGRKKMTQITRYLTVAITLVQAVAYVKTQIGPEAKTIADPMFSVLAAIVLTAGTLFVMWLGEKITDKGIGNGISLIIMAGIIAQLPAGLTAEWASRMSPSGGGPIPLLLEFVALFFVV